MAGSTTGGILRHSSGVFLAAFYSFCLSSGCVVHQITFPSDCIKILELHAASQPTQRKEWDRQMRERAEDIERIRQVQKNLNMECRAGQNQQGIIEIH